MLIIDHGSHGSHVAGAISYQVTRFQVAVSGNPPGASTRIEQHAPVARWDPSDDTAVFRAVSPLNQHSGVSCDDTVLISFVCSSDQLMERTKEL